MAKAGRKRKQGNRTPSGQLSRAGQLKRVMPNDVAAELRLLYGNNCTDAIGRAFASGLLKDMGYDGQDANAMLDTARAIHAAYWQAYTVGRIGCGLPSPMPSEKPIETIASMPMEPERVKARETWLQSCLQDVKKAGVRREFDALVIDPNPDAGPYWLDELLYAKRIGEGVSSIHKAKLRAALDGLEAIAL